MLIRSTCVGHNTGTGYKWGTGYNFPTGVRGAIIRIRFIIRVRAMKRTFMVYSEVNLQIFVSFIMQ